jgi:hypothetical protein
MLSPSAKAVSSSTRTGYIAAANLGQRRASRSYRHLHIDHGDVDASSQPSSQASSSSPFCTAATTVHIRLAVDQAAQTFHHQGVVIGQDNADTRWFHKSHESLSAISNLTQRRKDARRENLCAFAPLRDTNLLPI